MSVYTRSLDICIPEFPVADICVSGTNVEFTATATTTDAVLKWAPPAGPPPQNPHDIYNVSQLSYFEVKIGDEPAILEVGTVPYLNQNGELMGASYLGETITKHIRFASTHFPDCISEQTKLTIKVRSIAVAKRIYGNNEYGPAAILDKTLTIKVKPYNKGLILATQEEFIGGSYGVPPQPLPDGYAPASQRAAADARAKLTQMNHTVLPTSGEDQQQESGPNGENLAGRLSKSTAAFLFTHGEPTHFRSSKDDGDPSTGDDRLFWSEVASYVSRTGYPDHNLVVMHACSTLASPNGTQAPSKFKVLGTNGAVLADRAYAGFTAVVWSIGAMQWPLDMHAKKVYERLSAGDRVDEAVDKANKEYHPHTRDVGSLTMVVRGDTYARLWNVYMSKTEWNDSRRNSWYWVMN